MAFAIVVFVWVSHLNDVVWETETFKGRYFEMFYFEQSEGTFVVGQSVRTYEIKRRPTGPQAKHLWWLLNAGNSMERVCVWLCASVIYSAALSHGTQTLFFMAELCYLVIRPLKKNDMMKALAVLNLLLLVYAV